MVRARSFTLPDEEDPLQTFLLLETDALARVWDASDQGEELGSETEVLAPILRVKRRAGPLKKEHKAASTVSPASLVWSGL